MSEHHVVLRVGAGDTYSADHDPLILHLDEVGVDPAAAIRQHHLWEGLGTLGLVPPQVAVDLYRICAAAYCADLRIRRSTAFDGWTRQIVLHAPVAEPERWLPHLPTLGALLHFLSGDCWEIHVRDGAPPPPQVRLTRSQQALADAAARDERPIRAACLFSGGLDSFIGAADALANERTLLLVSHVPEGTSRFISRAQDDLFCGLKGHYEVRRLERLKVTLNPPRDTGTGKEPTQRARSILFLGLGTLAAAALGPDTPLIIPENGFISLNVPLTSGRLGSLSTRTTHPYAISLFRSLLEGIGIGVPLELPYMFVTKGEMMDRATDPDVVRRLAAFSNSCASPNPYGKSDRNHCGHCVPCIIRRSAMHHAGLDDVDRYRINILSPHRPLTVAESSHVKGFRLAIHRRTGGISATDLLAAGDLPRTMGSVADYRSVHDRGLAEVATFLDQAT